MRKIIFALNITIDGFADHTAAIADDELHDFYSGLLDSVDTVLLGRKTYQLMEDFWPNAQDYPESTKSMLRFADIINRLPKIVFSKTLSNAGWNNTSIVKSDPIEEVLRLKNQSGNKILVGGLSLVSRLVKADLIDEFRFLIHPIILGKGKKLFDNLNERVNLKLIDTKALSSGVIVMHYQKKSES